MNQQPKTEYLKGRRGFASNPLLVQDYERRKREMDIVRDQIAELKEKLHMLNLARPETN